MFYTPKDKGLPIGNLTSQIFANVYLNEIDQYIKRTLKVKNYIRYVDDMILLSDSKEELLRLRKEINNFLINNLKLELHKNKDKLGSVKEGINFLGYIVRPNYILSRRRVVSNLKNKLYFFNKGYLLSSNNQKQIALPLPKKISSEELDKILATINSYYGHFLHAHTYRLRRDLYDFHTGK
ncbi:RNA-directed DNA polymerase [Patescibacteria group bacterium]|nr:RNA-directed DNA polymerase [Patescibacteria group bacterium]